MSSIEFEEDKSLENHFRSRIILSEAKAPKMVRFLLKAGIVKSEKTAGNLLVALMIFFILATIAVVIYSRPASPNFKDGEIPDVIRKMSAPQNTNEVYE